MKLPLLTMKSSDETISESIKTFEHPLYVPDIKNEKAMREAVAFFVELLEEWEKRSHITIEYSGFTLADVVKSFSRDLDKIRGVDGVYRPNEFRLAGFISFWIRKLKPLNKVKFRETISEEHRDNTEHFLNEQFALVCGLAMIELEGLFADTNTIIEDIYRTDGRRLMRNLRYRAISPQAMTSYFQQAIELRKTQEETINMLLRAIEYRDDATGGHVNRVRKITVLLSKEIGLAPDKVHNLYLVSPMHDVGKIGVPDNILKKPDKLDATEWAEMKNHPELGKKILNGTEKSRKLTPIVKMAQLVSLNHHEKWDGTGYPRGLHQEDIPIEARIVAVADAYDAMRQTRCYRNGFDANKASQEIEGGRGTQFDPAVCDAFLKHKDEIELLYT